MCSNKKVIWSKNYHKRGSLPYPCKWCILETCMRWLVNSVISDRENCLSGRIVITVISDINLHAAPAVSSAQEANQAVQTGRNAGCMDRPGYRIRYSVAGCRVYSHIYIYVYIYDEAKMHLGAFCAANAPEREREQRARDVPIRTRLHAYRTAAGPRINKLHVRACKK